MINYFKIASLLSVSALLSACASSSVTSIKFDPTKTANGIVYHLPATQLSFELQQRLTDCSGKFETKPIEATITSKVVPDRNKNATFSIDTSELSHMLSEIPQAKFDLSNGLLTDINYQANDKTADVITSVANLAAISSGLPIISIPAAPTKGAFTAKSKMTFSVGAADICTSEAKSKLEEKEFLDAKINANTDRLAALSDKLIQGYEDNTTYSAKEKANLLKLQSLYTKAIGQLARNTDTKKTEEKQKLVVTIGNIMKSFEASLEKHATVWHDNINAQITAVSADTLAAETKLIKLNEYLTVKATATYLPSINYCTPEIKDKKTCGKIKSFKKFSFTSIPILKWVKPSKRGEDSYTDEIARWKNDNLFTVTLGCKDKSFDKTTDILATADESATAIYYRVPTNCAVKLKHCKNKTSCSKKAVQQIASSNIDIMQLGHPAFLTIENSTFESNTYTIKFEKESGSLSNYTFKAGKAPLSEGLKSVTSAYDALNESDAEKSEAEKTKLVAEKELIDAKTDLIEAEKNRIAQEIALAEEKKKLEELNNPSGTK